MICAQVKIMSLVLESWRCSPLTRHSMRRFCGSGIRAAPTRYGPTGMKPSGVLPIMNCEVLPSRYWRSRAEKSLPVA